MSVREDDYLALLYRLMEAGLEARLSLVSEELKVSAPAAAKVLVKLTNEGYVEKRGLTYVLTPKGLERARGVVKNHRVLEKFLADTLKVGSREAHELAHELEHLERFAELVDSFLKFPCQCPHGNPVPGRETVSDVPLSRVGRGVYTLARIGEVNEVLEWLHALTLQPGKRIEVVDVGLDHMVIRFEGREARLPLRVASLVFVKKG